MRKIKKFVKAYSVNGGRDIVNKLKDKKVNYNYVILCTLSNTHTGGEMRMPYMSFEDFEKRINSDDMVTQNQIHVKAYYLQEGFSVTDIEYDSVRKKLSRKVPHHTLYTYSRQSVVDDGEFTGGGVHIVDNVATIRKLRKNLPEKSPYYNQNSDVRHVLAAKRLSDPRELTSAIEDLVLDGSISKNPHLAHFLK